MERLKYNENSVFYTKYIFIMRYNTILKPVVKELNNDVILHIITIKKLCDNLEKLIDRKIIEIYSKWWDDDISIVKTEILNYLNGKSEKNSNLEIGAISEFFVHLYLNEIWFSQECLYENLEERSAKKWFDGYYSEWSNEWIIESKSGNITSKKISHKWKIWEAFSDLSTKLSGKSSKKSDKIVNNPWRNAWHHAKQANTNEDILKNIKKLSDNYTRNIYSEIKDHNVIPCSTIFLDGKKSYIKSVECDNSIEQEISRWVKKKTYKKMHIICITKETKKIFLKYLAK